MKKILIMLNCFVAGAFAMFAVAHVVVGNNAAAVTDLLGMAGLLTMAWVTLGWLVEDAALKARDEVLFPEGDS